MKFQINRNLAILALAVLLGLAAAAGMQAYLRRQVASIHDQRSGRTVRVVVAKDELTPDSVITSAAMAVREVPAEWAQSDAIAPVDFDSVEGRRLRVALKSGEMLMHSQVESAAAAAFSEHVARGRRAVTVQVDETNSISGMLQPGDHVDLIASVRKDKQSFTFALLQDVTVLATGARAESRADAPGRAGAAPRFDTITIDTSPADAELVLAARDAGKLEATLRAPGDEAAALPARPDARRLLGLDGTSAPAPAAPRGTVPVIYGGKAVATAAPR